MILRGLTAFRLTSILSLDHSQHYPSSLRHTRGHLCLNAPVACQIEFPPPMRVRLYFNLEDIIVLA